MKTGETQPKKKKKLNFAQMSAGLSDAVCRRSCFSFLPSVGVHAVEDQFACLFFVVASSWAIVCDFILRLDETELIKINVQVSSQLKPPVALPRERQRPGCIRPQWDVQESRAHI